MVTLSHILSNQCLDINEPDNCEEHCQVTLLEMITPTRIPKKPCRHARKINLPDNNGVLQPKYFILVGTTWKL